MRLRTKTTTWKRSTTVLMIASVGLGLVLGCGANELPAPVSVETVPPPALKTLLEDVAETGELGSGGEAIQQELDKLKESDEVKWKSLALSFEKLQSTNDPEAAKKLAKQMAAQL